MILMVILIILSSIDFLKFKINNFIFFLNVS